jgi:Tol biopolymer transport system component
MGGRRDDEFAYWRIDARTGEATALRPTRRFLGGYSAVSWMPDERSLAFIRHETEPVPTRFLVIRDIATGSERELARVVAPEYVVHMHPSPDGKWLAFVRLNQNRAAESELCVISTSGGEVRFLHRFQGMIHGAAWSPDARQIVFTATPKGGRNGELWKTALDSGATTSFDRDLGLPVRQLGQLEVHPNGRRILFAAGEPKTELWRLENFLPAKK